MVRQVVLLLVIIPLVRNYQTLVNGSTPYKISTLGGLVCASYTKRLAGSSVYAFKHLSCNYTDKLGHKKELMIVTSEQIVVEQNKQGHVILTTKAEGKQALRLGNILSRIHSSVAKSCLSLYEDAVAHTSGSNKISAQTGKGYRKLGSGNDTMYIKRFDNRTSWDEAGNVCLSENARLAKIDTLRKLNEIKANVSKPEDQFKRFYMWIGLRDFHRNNSFTWIDGSPLVFAHWYGDQPNETVINKGCVALTFYVFKGLYFSHRMCDQKCGFICEINKTSDVYP